MLLTRIGFPPEINHHQWLYFGLIGISPFDHKVYIWQVNYEYKIESLKPLPSHSKLILWRVNPVVPNSWERLPVELSLQKHVKPFLAYLDCSNSRVMFKYVVYDNQNSPVRQELLILCLSNGNFETFQSDFDLETREDIFNFFPHLLKEKVIQLDKRRKSCLAFTDHFVFYLEGDERDPTRMVVAYDTVHGTPTESPLCTMTPTYVDTPIKLLGSNDSAYFCVSMDYWGQDTTEISQIWVKENRLALTCVAEVPYIRLEGHISPDTDLAVCGDSKMAFIHGRRESNKTFLTVLCLKVPNLKFLATWAVQKNFGKFGQNGELEVGIGEDQLCKMIGYQKKLF